MRLPVLAAPLAALAVLAPLGACATATTVDHHQAPARAAVGDFGEATLIDASGARVGRAVLTQGPTGLLIKVEVSGLTPGWHGMHIHATGTCAPSSSPGPFTSAGAHINHTEPKTPHGLLNAAGPDDGDLPNLWVGADGKANAEVFTTHARIASEGPGQWLWDTDGSALVIHANVDDHSTQPIGGAGDRVVCGIMAAG